MLAPRALRSLLGPGLAVAVLTGAHPDHAYGEQTLRGVFARLLRGLDARLVLTPT